MAICSVGFVRQHADNDVVLDHVGPEGSMTIAYAALHQRLRYRGEDTGFYVVALDDGTVFINGQPPLLFDRKARGITLRQLQEMLPGTRVNIEFELS